MEVAKASSMHAGVHAMRDPSNGELQAVILAGGGGSRMQPLVAEQAKAMLDVGNRPLLFFQLLMVERSGLGSALVVTSKQALNVVSQYVNELYPLDWCVQQLRRDARSKSGMHAHREFVVEIVAVPDGSGTADALRDIADRITMDFVVISSDLVCDVELSPLISRHRVSNACLTMLLKQASGSGAEEKEKEISSVDYFGLDEGIPNTRALFMQAAADIENDSIQVSRSVIRSASNFVLHRDLIDAHVYVFSLWALSLLCRKKSHSSIKNEFVPFLIEKQHVLGKLLERSDEEQEANSLSATDLFLFAKRISNADRMMWGQHRNKQGGASASDRAFCGAFLLPPTAYLSRVNTIEMYLKANIDVAQGRLVSVLGQESTAQFDLEPASATSGNSSVAGSCPTPMDLKKRPRLGQDCIVGVDLSLGEKSSIKKSVLGDHCSIGSGVKMENCVVMDHVQIGDRSRLQNSVICGNSIIEAGCALKDCQVGYRTVVQEGREAKGERITDDDGDDIFF
ncbi:Translation initiation factor eIF-2B subunit gamma [Porphyridium purpureum]|uniref:Translation initiation factor eIF2B subunit gamma n=1 Tax=Porphyridium purpureum TaxID=35688 RepID=A0A5J4Z2F6_PORPP|nr:Translation initiation factor eIF-2B subunit gamma [Porphyridium purpureum]|eukprot:POR2038..scf208_2